MVGVFSRQAVIIQFGIWPEWNRSLPTNKHTWSNMFLKFLNKEACLDGESARWESLKSVLLWNTFSSYTMNYLSSPPPLLFFIKKEQLYEALSPLALFFFTLYYLGNDDGFGRSTLVCFSFCCSVLTGFWPVTSEWPCLCRAKFITIARTILWAFVWSDSTLWNSL